MKLKWNYRCTVVILLFSLRSHYSTDCRFDDSIAVDFRYGGKYYCFLYKEKCSIQKCVAFSNILVDRRCILLFYNQPIIQMI